MLTETQDMTTPFQDHGLVDIGSAPEVGREGVASNIRVLSLCPDTAQRPLGLTDIDAQF
ncbi:unnamed protein product [Penicillium roqueforti FM164]|uniref:Genomic scaffold, ProqFM164S02 n=1 Tax=Penicillium roqueforti (strain FM164) TaxID=1365484 RepID=W6Q2E2_PENRF|nr:unnamed protein product [Penicillium roqueforti FM164]